MGPILVFGHKNPDNDSVCSAVAYAHLKNLTDPDNVYVPARLGPVPPETEWVFARFGLQLPEQIAHVHTRVRDVMTQDVAFVASDVTMLDAGRLMRERGIRALPVVDGGVVKGLINQNILAERYLGDIALRGFENMPTTVEAFARAVDGDLIEGDPNSEIRGKVLIGAMEPATMLGYIRPGDVLIVGDRLRTQPMAIDAGVSCLMVTGGTRPVPEVIEAARARGAAVISTFHDTFAAARLVNLAHRVADLMDSNILYVEPDMLLSEASEDLFSSPHREAVVVDSRQRLVGVLTRTNIARGIRRRVILVDHNEISQSATGIQDAAVVEIVDHHRVGDVQTTGPILFLNLPVGSTATIVALRFRELDVVPPRAIAGVLLSALLSDTVLLKSPTTSDSDREVALWLAGIVEVEPLEFGLEMFSARAASTVFSAEHAVKADLKEYRVSDNFTAIGQIETVNADEVLKHAEELMRVMESLLEARRYDVVVLMVTDVVSEGSWVLAVGKTRIVERGLGVSVAEGPVWLDGVLSRKKQIAARLVDAVGS
ncbi:MAG: putative manganese-dependent inorganic diphosphatase [Coriobacteriia bacterium]|nr:putative manganese-dependent inorganic diphosphatase [Coriobacteriia bacterium]